MSAETKTKAMFVRPLNWTALNRKALLLWVLQLVAEVLFASGPTGVAEVIEAQHDQRRRPGRALAAGQLHAHYHLARLRSPARAHAALWVGFVG